ncbi:MAG: acyltransferase [Acidimicrobiales bacterium]|nr:acyltransferase [Acidimicrobiales bacterium]
MTEPARPAGPRLPHVAALDGLRGAAVAAVLLHHAGHLRGGWLGVDLFFVLSGYLITALLLQGWRDGGGVGLRAFWARRFRRLGPALVLTLVGTGIYAATVALPVERLPIRWDGIATLLEVANWRTILTGGDYWAAQLRPSPLRHTWSLSIEEQLYLIWPLALAFVLGRWRSARAVLVAAVGLALASATAMVVLEHLGASRSRLYYGTDTRASAVMVGAALAALRVVAGRERWIRWRAGRHLGSVAGALALAVAWVRLDGSSALPYQGVLPLAGLAGGLVVAGISDRRHPGPIGNVLALPPLTALGRISYGVYLYHWPLYLVIDQSRTGLGGWALTGARIAATLAIAAASYRWIEAPIRSGRMLAGRQGRAAVPAGAALAALALFAGTLGATKPVGILANVGGAIDRAQDPNAPVLMLVGDSVPLLLGAELSEQVDELDVSVLNRSVPGCHLLASLGPIRGIEGDVRTDVADCTAGGQYRKDAAKVRPDVSAVLFGEFPNEAVELDGRWAMPCEETYLEALRDRVQGLVDELHAGGGQVVLITAPGSDLSWLLERVPPGMDERVACTNHVLEEVAATTPNTSVVDLASFVCPPGEECEQEVDGVDLREDGLHFQGEGARYINRWLVPEVLAAAGLR